MSRKVMIVFEETDQPGKDVRGNTGKKFYVSLQGDTKRIKDGTPENELGSAEFWSWRCFQIVQQLMQAAGAFDPNNPMQDPKGPLV